jgi:peptidoglycan DL-endopeptidase CwlO
VIYTALSQLGKPYVTNGESPDVGFDCSGLTKYSWSKAGVTLEHQSEAQLREGEIRTFASAQPGDLLHNPGHIGLYLGVGRAMVHAVNHQTGLAIGIATEQMKDVIAPIS